MEQSTNEQMIFKYEIPKIEHLELFTDESIEDLPVEKLKQWLDDRVNRVGFRNGICYVIRRNTDTYVLMSKRKFHMFMLIEKHIDVKKCLLYCPSVL